MVLEHDKLVIAFMLAERDLCPIVVPGRCDVPLDACTLGGAREDQLAFECEPRGCGVGGNDGVNVDDGCLDGRDVIEGGREDETLERREQGFRKLGE